MAGNHDPASSPDVPRRWRSPTRRVLYVTVTSAALIVCTAVVLLTGAFSGGKPDPVQASARGVETFHDVHVPDIGKLPGGDYPTGTLEHQTNGEALRVESEWAEFESIAPVCNWEIVMEHSDLNGTIYRRQTTGLHSDCNNVGKIDVTWDGDAQPGKSCAILNAGGAEVARQCHNITAG